MNYLFVVAHPDDEMLGAGGLISKLCKCKSNKVSILYMTKRCPTREDVNLAEKAKEIYQKQGLNVEIQSSDYDCLGLKFVNHYKLVEDIEKAIKLQQPDVVFTHHPADINPDHNEVSKCCVEAVKLPIRKIPNGYNKLICALYYMFIPSSTDWSNDVSMNEFKADTFVEISKKDNKNKLSLLSQFDGIIRESPHPRSVSVLESYAKIAGAKIGYEYAEQFQTAFRGKI